ncbi:MULTISPECIES: hypothetical protein [unclassified Pseudomonas]|uniref:hypothetical protein n=1 Tax=Pseudomonas sp. Ant30-3 TaxID=1488328 RepID=UPI00048FC820|nr:hypothetical protein [Pseudomonas sp. Ant30-3]
MTTGKEIKVDSVAGHFKATINRLEFNGDENRLLSYPINYSQNKFAWSIQAEQLSKAERTVVIINFPTKLEPVSEAQFEFSDKLDSETTAAAYVVVYDAQHLAKKFTSKSGSLSVTYSQGTAENNRGSFNFEAKLHDKIVKVSGDFDLTGRTSANAGFAKRSG